MPHADFRSRSMRSYFERASDMHPKAIGYTRECAESMADIAYLDGLFIAIRRARHQARNLAASGLHHEAQTLLDFAKSMMDLVGVCSGPEDFPTDARVREWVSKVGTHEAVLLVQKALPDCKHPDALRVVEDALSEGVSWSDS